MTEEAQPEQGRNTTGHRLPPPSIKSYLLWFVLFSVASFISMTTGLTLLSDYLSIPSNALHFPVETKAILSLVVGFVGIAMAFLSYLAWDYFEKWLEGRMGIASTPEEPLGQLNSGNSLSLRVTAGTPSQVHQISLTELTTSENPKIELPGEPAPTEEATTPFSPEQLVGDRPFSPPLSASAGDPESTGSTYTNRLISSPSLTPITAVVAPPKPLSNSQLRKTLFEEGREKVVVPTLLSPPTVRKSQASQFQEVSSVSRSVDHVSSVPRSPETPEAQEQESPGTPTRQKSVLGDEADLYQSDSPQVT